MENIFLDKKITNPNKQELINYLEWKINMKN